MPAGATIRSVRASPRAAAIRRSRRVVDGRPDAPRAPRRPQRRIDPAQDGRRRSAGPSRRARSRPPTASSHGARPRGRARRSARHRARHRRTAGCLARSDELFRMIVDDANARPPGRRDDDPHPARRPARGRRLGRPARRGRRHAARLRAGRGLGRRSAPDRARAGIPGRAHSDRHHGGERYEGVFEVPATSPPRSSITIASSGRCRRSRTEPRDWTSGDVAFISTLATHAAIALTNAELFEQTVARAAQLEVLQAASARMSRATTVDEIGRTIVEETSRIIDYHNARVYLVEAPDLVVPIAFEGRVGAYERVDMSLLTCRLGEGFTGWVAAARRADPRQRRQPRSARRDDRRDRRRGRVDGRRADALRRADDRGHHALEARPRRVRHRTTCAS